MSKIGNKGVIGILASERNNFSWFFIDSLLRLKSYMGSEVSITHVHSGTIPDGRNAVLDIAKSQHADYVLMIDSDMTFPADGIQVLKRSMEAFDASIGCGIYFGTYPPYKSTPMAYVNNPNPKRLDNDRYDTHIPLDSWKETRYIDSCGMGFTFITKELFDIRFEFRPSLGEDYLFCTEARNKGHKIILEPKVKCGHLRMIPLDEEIIKKLTS